MSQSLDKALQMVARTDPGMLRVRNEDAVFVSPGLGLAILADGMGGYNGGEIASRMAVSRLADDMGRLIRQLPEDASSSQGQMNAFRLLTNEVGAANFAIYNAAQSDAELAGMGTTLVLAWFLDNRMFVAHVGDSRLYRYRGGQLEQLTKDHSLLQEQLDRGDITPEQARYSIHKNLVTRALGVEATVMVEVAEYSVVAGDWLLMCSDGLTEMVEGDEISATLAAHLDNPQLAADRLIEIANDHGGRDNISVILVNVRGEFPVVQGWWQQMLSRLK